MVTAKLRYVLLTMALGCGPSFHAIYEGNARFEHCYALEESTHSGMKERADCWRDWSERYTYGQTRDRIQYATARYVALSQSSNVPTDEALMMAAPGMTPRVTTITAPAPTTGDHPPPKVLDETDGAAGHQPAERPGEKNIVVGTLPDAAMSHASAPVTAPAPAPAPLPPLLPGGSCSTKCESDFHGCTPPDAGTCEKAYKTCMRGCFK